MKSTFCSGNNESFCLPDTCHKTGLLHSCEAGSTSPFYRGQKFPNSPVVAQLVSSRAWVWPGQPHPKACILASTPCSMFEMLLFKTIFTAGEKNPPGGCLHWHQERFYRTRSLNQAQHPLTLAPITQWLKPSLLSPHWTAGAAHSAPSRKLP